MHIAWIRSSEFVLNKLTKWACFGIRLSHCCLYRSKATWLPFPRNGTRVASHLLTPRCGSTRATDKRNNNSPQLDSFIDILPKFLDDSSKHEVNSLIQYLWFSSIVFRTTNSLNMFCSFKLSANHKSKIDTVFHNNFEDERLSIAIAHF